LAVERGRIEPIDIADEMRQSFIDYAMSVIASRALPDVRDGLKPVHRRILFAMHEAGNTAERPFRKSAKTVGEVIGNYHPHSDAAVYDALVRLAQDFSMRYPLVEGHGNFGSIDDDPPAAMRYCVTGETLVVTDRGLVRIDRLSPDGGEDVALAVLSAGARVHRASKWFDCGPFPTRRVRTRRGYEVTGTTNHPLLGPGTDAAGRPALTWRTIGRIRPGDWLALDRSGALWPAAPVDLTGCWPQPGGPSLPRILDRDLAFVLGALSAAGTAAGATVALAAPDGACAAAFQAAWAAAFPAWPLPLAMRRAVGADGPAAVSLAAVAPPVAAFLGRIGLEPDPAARAVPEPVLRAPRAVAAAFLRGLFEAGATLVPARGGVPALRLTAASRTLLRQVQTLLLRFGVASRRAAGVLTVAEPEELRAFAAAIGFASPGRRRALAALGPAGQAPAAPYLFDQVVAVEDAGRQPVYSLRVDSACHSFVADGFVNHNTEARLSPIAAEMLRDLDKDTVDFVPNYDERAEEPVVLPARFPNLLANGAAGIAVGMATNIPPHNLRELIDGTIALIDQPELTSRDLMRYIKGPDFPTGALIMGREGIREAYETGRGTITIRARAQIEEVRGDRYRIVVTEIPYQVIKARLIERIADLVREKRLEGVSDLRDETDRSGLRIVIELARGANANVVLNKLFKETPLQQNFGVIMLALVDGSPRVLSLRQMLLHYIGHQREVVTRRCRFELDRAEKRAHILEGLRIALDHIDEVIALIRASHTTAEARSGLQDRFGLSEAQADAILDMRLQRLTGLEREKLEAEYDELKRTIEYLRAVLASPAMLDGIIKTELREVRDRYGDERRTQITGEAGELSAEDLIAEQDVVITLTHRGYCKRLPVDTYRSQGRGGRGVTGIVTRDEDFVEQIFVATTHDDLLFFTNQGRAYPLKVHEIPEAGRTARGTAAVNLLQLGPEEKITAVVVLPSERDRAGRFLVMATRGGVVKRCATSEFANVRKGGIIAVHLDPGDELIDARLTSERDELILVTRLGQALRFPGEDLRPMGRAARGVRGIRLDEGDRVIAAAVVVPDGDLLVVSERGIGKRTPLREFPVHHRGGGGVRAMRLSERTGVLAGAQVVLPGYEVMLISAEGVVIRQQADGISRQGRGASGVTLMRLEPGDHLVAVAPVPPRSGEGEG
jgi:DNA gyrase subunit A